jgi:hypothetical protein
MEVSALSDAPSWHLRGDWFDVCKCAIPCPCTFAQPPTEGDCAGVLIWHIDEGKFGDVTLDGLNFAAVATFEGNIWDEGTKADMGFVVDERADESQREAMQTIFSGQAGGWPAAFAAKLGQMLGMEPARIDFEIASDHSSWEAEIPGMVKAGARALEGPTSVPGRRTTVHDPPGSEVGPGSVATYGTATAGEVSAFGFDWDWAGRSSKHMAFEWSGPD